ncbi:MAG: tetraacyldisaccharide 4'-kinase [Micavibrio sp.]|nr:MAG: tetraacyldisaccharide 4'-kinase [Micavibrio sp.]
MCLGLKFKTPSFWYRRQNSEASLQEMILTPLSWAYGTGHRINTARQSSQKADMPVICIGNLVAGGSGKTPVALSLMQLISGDKLAEKPHFLTRGYGSNQKGPLLVDYFENNASEVGDESLLLAKTAFTILSADRPAGAHLAKEKNADLLIMDDGLQNSSLHKDISFVVIDGASGFGNGKLLPAGPLRETLESGFAKADAFVLIGKDKTGAVHMLPEDKPLFNVHVEVADDHKPPTTKPYIAFAGLGRPEKFYHLLQKLNYDIAGWRPFPDHYVYKRGDIYKLIEEAKEKNATLITTEKDFLRLPEEDWGTEILQMPIQLVWENEKSVVEFIRQRLKETQSLQAA